MTDQFFTKTLPPNTAKLTKVIQKSKPKFLDSFYLSGGTALSLQIGHRESEDLDFFSQKSFNPEKIQAMLTKYGNLKQAKISEGTLETFINGVQLQFLEYPYDLLIPTKKWQSINLSSVEDIACTKLLTISSRGSKKDFIDLYFLLQRYTLNQLFSLLKKKYPNTEYNQPHILKSLTYFLDADHQPTPRMHQDASWEEVKQNIIKSIKSYKF